MIFFLKRGIAKVTYKKYSLNYLWNQYNVNSNTTYTEQVTDANYEHQHDDSGPPRTVFARKVNRYTIVNDRYPYYVDANDHEPISIEDDLSGITLAFYKDYNFNDDDSFNACCLIKNATTKYTGYDVQDGTYGNYFTGTKYEVVFNTTYSKGTYIGTVTASSRSAYRTNGTSDNTYWYVYQGTVKGEEIGTIEALPGEYPEDGEQDGYWYVRQ